MKNEFIRHRTFIAVLACLSPAVGSAADLPHIRVRNAPSSDTAEIQRRLAEFHKDARRFETRLAGGVFDARASGIVDAADRFTKTVFRASDLNVDRTVTYQDERGDNALISWKGKTGIEYLLLDDSPFESDYRFWLGPATIASPDNIEEFLSGLLRWDQQPLRLSRGEVTLQAVALGGSVIAFWGEAIRSSYPRLADISIDGVTDGSRWFLTVQVPKGYTEEFYPGSPMVPERFPALAELAKTWSYERIRAELGQKPASGYWRYFADRRDAVLFKELASRGLSKEQFTELMLGTDVSHLSALARAVIGGMVAAGRDAQLPEYVRPALSKYADIGPPAAEAARSIFIGWPCKSDWEATALWALHERLTWEGPLGYLSLCPGSVEAVRTMEALQPPESAREALTKAIDEAKKRLMFNSQNPGRN